MWLKTLLLNSARSKGFHPLYDSVRFGQALERERARADRWGQTLSLLSLGSVHSKPGQATLRHVVRVLRRRMRVTDEAGWLDGKNIGILLPNTPASGAWTLAEKICSEFPAHIPQPKCRVYCYPSDWFLGDENRAAEVDHSSGETRRAEAMEPLFFQGLPLWKRALDLAGASFGLVLLLPVMLLVGALLKMTSRGPVFFRQSRVGLGGRPFTMVKFRTMVVGAERLQARLLDQNEQEGPIFKITNDPRITGIGRFLRKTSLDELPQLWNVLLGEMSLVGPRPPLQKEVVQYESWQRRRLFVTPGITCIWQVKGRSRIGFTDWMRMDLEYIEARSPWSDLKLLFLTVPAVLLRRGAS